jgi:hypothetical protein
MRFQITRKGQANTEEKRKKTLENLTFQTSSSNMLRADRAHLESRMRQLALTIRQKENE